MSELERITGELRAWTGQLDPAATRLISTARRIEGVARSLPARVDASERGIARRVAQQLRESIKPTLDAAAWVAMAQRTAEHWIGRQGGSGPAGVPRDLPLRPIGFEGEDDFQEFVAVLRRGLEEIGFGDAGIAFRGSSVTGRSYLTGREFGSHSDYDLALIGSGLMEHAGRAGIQVKPDGTRTFAIHDPAAVNRIGLRQTQKDLQGFANREVTFMIYESGDAVSARGPYLLTEGL